MRHEQKSRATIFVCAEPFGTLGLPKYNRERLEEKINSNSIKVKNYRII